MNIWVQEREQWRRTESKTRRWKSMGQRSRSSWGKRLRRRRAEGREEIHRARAGRAVAAEEEQRMKRPRGKSWRRWRKS